MNIRSVCFFFCMRAVAFFVPANVPAVRSCLLDVYTIQDKRGSRPVLGRLNFEGMLRGNFLGPSYVLFCFESFSSLKVPEGA